MILFSLLVTNVWGSIGKDSLAKCLYEEAVASSQVIVTSSKFRLHISSFRTRYGVRLTATRQAMEP